MQLALEHAKKHKRSNNNNNNNNLFNTVNNFKRIHFRGTFISTYPSPPYGCIFHTGPSTVFGDFCLSVSYFLKEMLNLK
jgi:hypothetical protein